MEQTESEITKALGVLEGKNSEEKIIFLESLYDYKLSGNELELICDYIEDSDKGVRNSVLFLLINNELFMSILRRKQA